MQKFFLFIAVIFFLLISGFHHPVLAYDGGIVLNLPGRVKQADTAWKAVGQGIELHINRRAKILLDIPPTEKLQLHYKASSDILLTVAVVPAGWLGDMAAVDRFYTPHVKLLSGTNDVVIDIRQASFYEPTLNIILLFEGSGSLTISSASIIMASGSGSAIRFLEVPIHLWLTTINFLNKSNVSVEGGYTADSLIGLATLLLMVAATVFGKKKVVPYVATTGVILIGLIFLIRFAPSVAMPFASVEQRTRHNSIWSEVGNMANLLAKNVSSKDLVAVDAELGDWYSKEAMCFYAAPAACVYYEQGKEKLKGSNWIPAMDSKKVTVFLSIGGLAPLPDGFKIAARISDGSYLARRE